MDHLGLRIVSSPYAPKGTIYVIDEAALWDSFDVAPLKFSEPEWGSTFETPKFTAMAEFGLRFGATEVERDPLERGLSHTFRGVWRQMRAVFGYEWRKATGQLRRYPKQRHAIVTGITA
jgi:hypothetical protein